ncbi:hypothetical protein KSF_095710 [Reticulibacter mediterranei]|uniref:Uncharacterized protein n=1 Tax=Reticulibacter mediterranei TaxID=2778369 RepID=A0A8J3IVX0_9CHLR|nr:hypothetical protein [Reticulibacter mediterranei]GHO99523.1 hypothetical protein KSF_095710 [Reticulibacter mediterranei]
MLHDSPDHASSLPQRIPRPIVIRPRLIDLLNKHSINTVFLARAAHLQVSTVRAMVLQEMPVQPVVAMQCLHGLWELTGQRYLLTDIDMPTLPYS